MITVLVVDDHPVLRWGVVAVLGENPGLQVVGEAVDGEQAVAMTLDLAPDVVVMDVTMPVMDGIEATRTIRALRPATQVVVITAEMDAARHAAALAAGAVQCVAKGLAAADLVLAVHSAVASAPAV